MVEHAVVLALVACVVFFSVSFLGYAVHTSFNRVTADLARQARPGMDSGGHLEAQQGADAAPAPAPVPWTMRFETWIAFASLTTLGVFVFNLLVLRRALRDKEEDRLENRLSSEGLKEAVFHKRQEIYRILSSEMELLLFECQLEVRHVMSQHVAAVGPTLPIDEVKRVMGEKHVRHLLVCEGSTLIGIISDRDLAKKSAKTAAEAMTPKPHFVEPETPLNPAITQLVQRRISCLPVVSDGEVVGVLTSTDLMMTLQCALQVLKRVAGEVVSDIEQDQLVVSPGIGGDEPATADVSEMDEPELLTR